MTENSKDKFLLLFNPDNQVRTLDIRIASLTEKSKNSGIPTLVIVSKTFGEETTVMWLKVQLTSIITFAGIKIDETVDVQLKELARIISKKHYMLNVYELMKFFAMFKSGEYDGFYGKFEPLLITKALLQFREQRCEDIDKYEKENIAKEIEQHKNNPNAISYQEYQQIINQKKHV